MTEIPELILRITEASCAYYGGQPVISDEEFDKLLSRLRELDPENPILTRAGHGYVPSGKEESDHTIPTVGTLPKVHNLASIKKGDVITPKLDGLSLTAYYSDGKLDRVLTRGDGKIGIIVTNKVSIPQKISDKVVAVRGEAILYLDKFMNGMSDTYANPRNAVSGILNSNTSEYFDSVEFVGFEVVLNDGSILKADPESVDQMIEVLKKDKFTPIPFIRFNNQDTQTLKKWKNLFNIATDGIVHNGVEAIKFATDDVETEIQSIEWNATSTGRIIPVAIFTPVKLYGTTVSRATALHYQFVSESGLGKGAIVKITKANEIIPQIVSVVKSVDPEIITRCPACGAELVKDGVNLKCSNLCVVRDLQVNNFISTYVPIKGLGGASLAKFREEFRIKTMLNLIEFIDGTPELFITRSKNLTDHMKGMYIDMIRTLTENPLDIDKLLLALNIPGIGYSNSQALSGKIQDIVDGRFGWEDSIVQNRDQISQNLSDPQIRNIISVIIRSQKIKFVKIEKKKMRTVVLTGKMSRPRSQMVKMLNEHGFTEGSLNKDSILICADKSSGSSKMNAAKNLGIPIMSEDEFFEYVRK